MADTTFASRMLKKIENVLEDKATDDVKSYEMNGKRLDKYSFDELMALRDKLKLEVARESGKPLVKIRCGKFPD